MRIIFSFLFTLHGVASVAQGIAFPVSDANWMVVQEYPLPGNPPGSGLVTWTYSYDGDTLIDNQLWSRIYENNTSVFVPGDPSNIFRGHVYAANGVVYFMSDGQIHPTVMYDFNIQPGDTVKFYQFCCGAHYDLFLQSIDSVVIDGQYRRRFNFSPVVYYNTSMKETWIEGIGSVHGPLFPITAKLFNQEFPDALTLSCFSHQSALIYHSPQFPDCYYYGVTSIGENDKGLLTIFPNPASSGLTVVFPSVTQESALLRLLSLTGRELISKNVPGGVERFELDVISLPPGIFILEVLLGKQKLTARVVVVR